MHREFKTIGGGKDGEDTALSGDSSIQVRTLSGAAITAALRDLAALRIEVFREFPYLYDGDFDYERKYLSSYAASPGAVVVGAYEGARLIGAATGAPLEDEKAAWTEPLVQRGYRLEDVFYFGESVLLPDFRGKGLGHRFFDVREATARAQGKRFASFVAVVRPDDHVARPDDYRALDPFWRRRGYEKVDGAVAEFEWREIGETVETTHQLQYWAREL